MKVLECMTKSVEIGRPDMTIREAAEKMRDWDFGILPIGKNDRLIGVITDRDIVIRAVAEGLDPQKSKIEEIISERVLYCYEDQDLDDVVRNLGDNQVRRMPVLNRQKRLVGILSLGDIAVTEEDPEKVDDALARISQKVNRLPEYRY